jgi:hypothetical protein
LVGQEVGQHYAVAAKLATMPSQKDKSSPGGLKDKTVLL